MKRLYPIIAGNAIKRSAILMDAEQIARTAVRILKRVLEMVELRAFFIVNRSVWIAKGD
jgi:hypothetical protein